MRELPESWISPVWLDSLGQIGLLARLGSTKILTVRVRPRRTPRHTSASRDPSHLSATKQPIRQRLAQPARKSGATHLSGTDPPLRSSLDSLPPAMGAAIISMAAGCLPLSGGRPAHPEGLVSIGLFAKHPPRHPASVMSSSTEDGVKSRGRTGLDRSGLEHAVCTY